MLFPDWRSGKCVCVCMRGKSVRAMRKLVNRSNREVSTFRSDIPVETGPRLVCLPSPRARGYTGCHSDALTVVFTQWGCRYGYVPTGRQSEEQEAIA